MNQSLRIVVVAPDLDIADADDEQATRQADRSRSLRIGLLENGFNLIASLPASKATIASRLSLTPEYFSRVLHELEAQKLITIDRREIRILDVQKLLGYGAQ